MSGCGKRDRGLGKGGPKRLRKMLQSNTRGPTKPAIRCLMARKMLGEKTELQIGSWPRASSIGWRQETRAGRMVGGPTERASKRPPDGDCAKNGGFGLNSGSLDFFVQMKWVTPKNVENQWISIKDAASWVDSFF
jgi:hypothetical protein